MRSAGFLLAAFLWASVLAAQVAVPPSQDTVPPVQDSVTRGDPLTNEGIERASYLVDSVFVDRLIPEAVVDGGDWGSYLMARLGVYPIPDDLLFRVTVDTSHIEMFGTIADLPFETRQVLSPILGFFDPGTTVVARIELRRVGIEVIDFRLASVAINGIRFPESALARFLTSVGSQYPVLTDTGRNLLVKVPKEAVVTLEEGGVRLKMREIEGL